MGIAGDDSGVSDGDGRCDCDWGENLLRRAWAAVISGGDAEYYAWLVNGRADDDRAELLTNPSPDEDAEAIVSDIHSEGVLGTDVLQCLSQ
jgi:hypothetical protein